MAYGTFTSFTGSFPAAITAALSTKPGTVFMYLEYVNDDADIPEYATDDDIQTQYATANSYYSELATTANYVRVQAIQDPVIVESSVVDSLDTTYSSTIRFIGQTAPTSAGVLDNDTELGSSSLIYGAALVLAEDLTDLTKDRILARAYFTDAPIEKVSGTEASVTFPLTITSTTTASA